MYSECCILFSVYSILLEHQLGSKRDMGSKAEGDRMYGIKINFFSSKTPDALTEFSEILINIL